MPLERWRIHRDKSGTADDTDWRGTITSPGSSDRAEPVVTSKPLRSIVCYVVPRDVSNVALAPGGGNCSISGVGITDVDNDETVDAGTTDYVFETSAQASVPYYTPVEIPMFGALRYTVRVTSTASNPAGTTQLRIMVLEVPAE